MRPFSIANMRGVSSASTSGVSSASWDLPLPNEWFAGDWDRIKEIVEPKMEKIILDAANEQGIKLELVPSATTGKIELEAA